MVTPLKLFEISSKFQATFEKKQKKVMELNRTSSEVALPEFHKKSYRPSFNCCFGQSTFQSLVLLSLILLHVVLIVIFLPLVSSSIVRLNEIVDRVDAINSKIDAIDSKVDAIDGKIKKLDEAQIQIEGKMKIFLSCAARKLCLVLPSLLSPCC